MVLGKPVPDKTLLRSVTQKLAQKSGGSGAKINATVAGGIVTLSGVLTTETQRKILMSAMAGIGGIKRVVDSMSVAPPKKREQ
jgi:osmotically-inducible protein OsmY